MRKGVLTLLQPQVWYTVCDMCVTGVQDVEEGLGEPVQQERIVRVQEARLPVEDDSFGFMTVHLGGVPTTVMNIHHIMSIHHI